MEFANLGNHCNVSSCRQHDFLPFTCDACGKDFCLQHRSYTSHSCPKANKQDKCVISCPLCNQTIQLRNNEDPNITFDRHTQTSCAMSRQDNNKKKKQRCSAPDCNEVLTFTNRTKCDRCGQYVCLRHRFGDDHACSTQRRQNTSGFLSRLGFNGSSTANSSKSSNKATKTSNRPRLSNLRATLRETAARRMRGQSASTASGSSIPVTSNVSSSSSASSNAIGSNTSSLGNGNQEQCPVCNQAFADPVQLVQHYEQAHQTNESSTTGFNLAEQVYCPHCGEGFNNVDDVIMHANRVHSTSDATQSSTPSGVPACTIT